MFNKKNNQRRGPDMDILVFLFCVSLAWIYGLASGDWSLLTGIISGLVVLLIPS